MDQNRLAQQSMAAVLLGSFCHLGWGSKLATNNDPISGQPPLKKNMYTVNLLPQSVDLQTHVFRYNLLSSEQSMKVNSTAPSGHFFHFGAALLPVK